MSRRHDWFSTAKAIPDYMNGSCRDSQARLELNRAVVITRPVGDGTLTKTRAAAPTTRCTGRTASGAPVNGSVGLHQ